MKFKAKENVKKGKSCSRGVKDPGLKPDISTSFCMKMNSLNFLRMKKHWKTCKIFCIVPIVELNNCLKQIRKTSPQTLSARQLYDNTSGQIIIVILVKWFKLKNIMGRFFRYPSLTWFCSKPLVFCKHSLNLFPQVSPSDYDLEKPEVWKIGQISRRFKSSFRQRP